MSNVVGEIAINVTADVGPLMREMGRGTAAMSGLNRMSSTLSGGLKRFGRATTDLGKKLSVVSAGIAAVGAATFALVKQSADAGDAIAKNARSAGVSADYYQELGYAIGQVTDLAGEELDAALVRLTKTIGEAAEGSKSAADALTKLGFSQSQVESGTITTQQAFDAYIAKLDGTTSAAEAAALSTDLFGKAGARMGGQLMGAQAEVQRLRDDARSLGLVMSADALNASEKFGDQMDTLQQSFGAVVRVIGAELLPLFTEWLIPTLQDKVIPAMAAVAESIREWVKWFNDLPGPVKDAVGAIALAIGVGGPLLIAVGAASSAIGLLVGKTGPIGLFIAAAGLLTAAWVGWGDDFMAAVGGAVDWVTAKFEAFLAMLDRIIEKAKEVGAAIATAFQPGSLDVPENFGPGAGWMEDKFGSGHLTGGMGSGAAGGPMGGQMMGAAIVNGMVLGAVQTMEQRRQELMDLFGQVPQMARDVLGIQSPSTVFAEIGNFLGQGMAQGIQESQALVGQATAAMGQTAVTAADGTVSGILNSMSTLFQGSKKFAMAQALINAWTGASEALKLPFPSNLAAFAKVLATGMNAVKNIKSAQPGSTGGGSAGAGGGGAAAPAQVPVQTMNFTVQNDPFGYGERFARSIADQLNNARRSGSSIIATVT